MTKPQDEITLIRAEPVCLADVRSFTVTPSSNYLPGMPSTVWKLRCYGRGISSLGEGNPKTYPNHSVAEACGENWIKSGIEPAYQGMTGRAF